MVTSSLPGIPSVLDGRFYLSRGIAPRNIDQARGRWLRPQVARNNEDMGPITLDDRAALRAPSNDEDTLDLHAGAPAVYSPLGSFKSFSDADSVPGFG